MNENSKIITDIVPIDKKRDRIYVDGEYAFPLYKGEVFSLSLEINKEISDEVYRQVYEEILPKRCKLRAMHLLEKRPYTRMKLKNKLLEGLYPEDIVEEALQYVESFHYIDDELYARDYILSQLNVRSEKDIKLRLRERGIEENIYEKVKYQLMDEGFFEDEEEKLIEKQLRKKGYSPDMEYEDKLKILNFLYRKGFSTEKIRKAMDGFEI